MGEEDKKHVTFRLKHTTSYITISLSYAVQTVAVAGEQVLYLHL